MVWKDIEDDPNGAELEAARSEPCTRKAEKGAPFSSLPSSTSFLGSTTSSPTLASAISQTLPSYQGFTFRSTAVSRSFSKCSHHCTSAFEAFAKQETHPGFELDHSEETHSVESDYGDRIMIGIMVARNY